MSNASVRSFTVLGVQAVAVTVEVHIAGGLPGTTIVGLPQSAVRESKDRVRAALQHAGFGYPQVKVVVNLAPADLPKRGGRFDLPIALGILVAAGHLPPAAVCRRVCVGELGLTGTIRPVTGILPGALALSGSAFTLVLPTANAAEAGRAAAARVLPVEQLSSACRLLAQSAPRNTARTVASSPLDGLPAPGDRSRFAGDSDRLIVPDPAVDGKATAPDLVDVVGQRRARRALEIAAAGGHNLLFVGPPGTGKSLLARCLEGLLPPMTEREALEAATLASISPAGFDQRCFGRRPFRAPHHTASGVALVGGGMPPLPGEVSLAHRGVLFLDEIAEFPRSVLDVLRQPLESGRIEVSRAAYQAEFPARFQLIATMNPCPCGYYGDPEHACGCSPDVIERYQRRLSGPLRDRIDMQLELRRLRRPMSRAGEAAESSEQLRSRIAAARQRQRRRQGATNAEVDMRTLDARRPLPAECAAVLARAAERLRLSLRGLIRVQRVARTISDLEASENVLPRHVVEALSYRQSSDRVHPVS